MFVDPRDHKFPLRRSARLGPHTWVTTPGARAGLGCREFVVGADFAKAELAPVVAVARFLPIVKDFFVEAVDQDLLEDQEGAHVGRAKVSVGESFAVFFLGIVGFGRGAHRFSLALS
jgi:hypothetical protein